MPGTKLLYFKKIQIQMFLFDISFLMLQPLRWPQQFSGGHE